MYVRSETLIKSQPRSLHDLSRLLSLKIVISLFLTIYLSLHHSRDEASPKVHGLDRAKEGKENWNEA
ncbi:MAG: hypothetical protein DRO05_00045 [Thermoproteota archaeon]|nr:MAG: hypothetical protein DRO05_00045 [Candidatus Korarchaeota archaeon]